MLQIYQRQEEYDLEHVGDEDDRFYVDLARSLKTKLVLELACGTGRITIPMAEEGARSGFSVVDLDAEATTLKTATERVSRMSGPAREGIGLVRGDMRKWHSRDLFDLIIVPCSSITHLLELKDQLKVWRRAFQNLAAGGRFAVEAPMPNFSSYADSFANPPRALVEIDRDVTDQKRKIRLVRRRTVTYLPDEQRARSVSCTKSINASVLSRAMSTTSKATSIFRANSACCSSMPALRSKTYSATTIAVR